MDLKEFKQHINNFPKGTQFNYGISEPFSWRGVYAEVAFEILKEPMKKEDILKNIELAYTEEFIGYKGGEYRYNDYTEVHFERDVGSWSDGEYVSKWIAEIEHQKPYESQEHRFINLAFCP